MKKLLLVATACLVAAGGFAQGLKTPMPSPTQTIKQDFGLSSIELSYSRPAIKGRTIFGDLVPFGKVWRTGANNATTISFGDDVVIGGKKIPAGRYGLLTIPGKEDWTVIITRQLDVTAPAAYQEQNDIARVNARPTALPMPVENLTMQFANVKPTTCDLNIAWEKTKVTLPITTDIDSKIMAQIKDEMDKDSRPYFSAAMYYMETGRDLKQALEWLNKAEVQNPRAFWVAYQKANCLAKLGQTAAAKTSANKSIELAKEAKNDDYVALNQKLLATLK